MSKKFTASNGGTVNILPGSGDLEVIDSAGGCFWIDKEQIPTLREYFRNERDQELGRWRWPENPDYVVTPRTQKIKSRRVVRVLRESTGNVNDIREVEPTPRSDDSLNAARAYFAAHPEPKPWHDAKPGEVWLFQGTGEPLPIPFIKSTVTGNWVNPAGKDLDEKYTATLPYGSGHDPSFEPRRIWPEN